MSRQGTLELVQEVKENLEVMRKTQQIKPVKVKSILENLRSSLEYVANDTYDKYIDANSIKQRPDIYFPYGKQGFVNNFFTKTLNLNKPSTSPLYNIFNSIQDYHTGENWLVMMCNLTNEVKHRQPISLKEDDFIKKFSVSVGGAPLIYAENSTDISFKNNTVNGRKIEDFTLDNEGLNTFGNGQQLNIILTKDKKIRFHGVNYDVIPFIELCLDRIETFIIKAYDELDKI